jgi:hypothetical protein
MKHLQKFEELDPSTYRSLRDRTADYPFSQFKAQTPEMKDRAEKMGRINQLSGERFEEEFFNQFPKGTKITVCDEMSPNTKVELELDGLVWRANWTYYDVDFKQRNSPFYRGNMDVHIRFKGDTAMRGSGDAYTMDPGHKLGFKGQIMVDESSINLLNSMFQLGKQIETKPIEETPAKPKEEEPKGGFISKMKDFFK